MKRYISLLLALVMVVGMIPTIGALATEENTAATIEENFDDIALEIPTVDTIPGVGTYNAAQVKPAPDRDGYALWVGDEAAAVVPGLCYNFEDTSNVTVEFDVNPNDMNALNILRIYNNDYTKFPNVALALNFSNQGLRYYDGNAWSAYDKSVTTPINQWSKIRIELIPGKSGEAKIYVNDVEALVIPGTAITKTMADNATSVNGIYFASNTAQRSFYLDNLKITPAPYVATYEPTSATDFNDMEVGTAPGAPITTPSLATVTTESKADSNVVHLNDNSDKSAACVGLNVEDSESVKMSFKYKGVKGAMQVYITDGARNTGNTAFWLQFNGKNVQYYDGVGKAWVTLKALDYFLTSWYDISIEANTTTAKIYVKGELVGEAPRSGGSYGTNVTNVLDSAYIVIGGASSATTSNCYIDDVSLSGNSRKQMVTPTVSCNFNSMVVGAAPGEPVASAALATVATESKADSNVVHLNDNASTSAAYLGMNVGDSATLDLSFKYKGVKGAMQIYITDGARNTANTAFWLQFSGKNVQYYDGVGKAWVTLKTLDYFLTSWYDISIEANTTTAKIYVKGEFVGEAPRSGGSYGTNVTDVLDSIYFVVGNAASASTNNCYIDDVELCAASYELIVTPDVIDENFDAYYPVASVENVERIVASAAAEIVANPIGEGNAVLLHDATASTAGGNIDFAFDLVDSYILEYDAFIPTSANDVCMQIHAGQEGNRMAYVLAFNRAYGVRVLTGRSDVDGSTKWVNLEETATKLTPNAWNKIRVEVNTGDENGAAIYLNDKPIVTTSEAYYKANDVVGAYIYSGDAAQYVYIDNLKFTPVEPEDDSIDGVVDTEVGLMLEQDVTIDELTIDADTTLDLNGYTLTVTNLVVYGSIIDTSADNAGKVVSENTLFLGEMEYMPIYADGGYKFFDYELKNLGARAAANGKVTYGFAIDFANADAYALLASADCGVKVNMTLAWGENEVPFTFDAALVQQYAALQAKFPNMRAAMMLNVTGVDTLEAGQTLTVTPAVKASGLTAGGDAMVYTVA